MTTQKILVETFNHIHPIKTENLIAEVQNGLERTSGLVALRCGNNIDSEIVLQNKERIRSICYQLANMPPEELNEALQGMQKILNSPPNSIVPTPEYAAA